MPQADGAGNDLLAGRYLQLAMIMYTITSIPAVFLWIFYTDEVVLWFGFDEETAVVSQRFAYSFLVNVFLSGLDHGIHEFLNVTGHEKYSTVVQILYFATQTVSIIISVSVGIKDLLYVGLVQAFLGVMMSIANFAFVLYRGWMDKYWEGFATTLSLRVSKILKNTKVKWKYNC